VEGLGLDLRLFIFQVVNFGILFFGLNYFLHKPIRKLLEGRRSEIKHSLEAAEQARKELHSSEEEQEKILHQARTEAQGIVEAGRQQAKKLEAKLEAATEERIRAMQEEARAEIERAKSQLRDEVKQELAGLVLHLTAEILDQQIDDATKSKHIEHLVHQIEA